ncbi:MAG: hypothetical protein ACE5ES_04540 [Candidatus Nanoarchaeia archaeon]
MNLVAENTFQRDGFYDLRETPPRYYEFRGSNGKDVVRVPIVSLSLHPEALNSYFQAVTYGILDGESIKIGDLSFHKRVLTELRRTLPQILFHKKINTQVGGPFVREPRSLEYRLQEDFRLTQAFQFRKDDYILCPENSLLKIGLSREVIRSLPEPYKLVNPGMSDKEYDKKSTMKLWLIRDLLSHIMRR